MRRIVFIVGLCVLIAFFVTGPAWALNENVALLGRTGGGSQTTAVMGDTLIVTLGSTVVVLDASDPAAMVEIDRWGYEDMVSGLDVDGTTLAVAALKEGVFFYDLTDPANKTYIGHVESGAAYAVHFVGGLAYVADGGSGLTIIDNYTTAPEAVGQADVNADPGEGVAASLQDLIVMGSYCYAASFTAGLSVYDVSDPSAPLLVWNTPHGNRSLDVAAVDADTVVLADYTAGFTFFDVSTPTEPVNAGSTDTGTTYGVEVVGTTLYLCDWTGGIKTYDISNTGAPALQDTYDPNSFFLAVEATVVGDTAYVCGYREGIHALDVTDPANLQFLGDFDEHNLTYDAISDGDYVYIADWGKQFRVVDVTGGLDNPAIVYEASSGANGIAVDLMGDTVALGTYNTSPHVRLYDVADPANPAMAGSTNVNGRGVDVMFGDNDQLHVADYTSGYTLLDIANPASPSALGSTALVDFAWAVDYSGNYAYVGDDDGGLQIVDISTPSSPVPVASLLETAVIYGCAVVDNYVYAGGRDGFLYVVDVTDPANPATVNSIDIGMGGFSVCYEAGLLYVTTSGGPRGLTILDVSDRENPVVRAWMDALGSSRRSNVKDGVLYWSVYDAGVVFVKYEVFPDDTDGDGIDNATEGIEATPDASRDTDGDGMPDYLDHDSDNDGFSDFLEDGGGYDPYDDTNTPPEGFALPLGSLTMALGAGIIMAAARKRIKK